MRGHVRVTWLRRYTCMCANRINLWSQGVLIPYPPGSARLGFVQRTLIAASLFADCLDFGMGLRWVVSTRLRIARDVAMPPPPPQTLHPTRGGGGRHRGRVG